MEHTSNLAHDEIAITLFPLGARLLYREGTGEAVLAHTVIELPVERAVLCVGSFCSFMLSSFDPIAVAKYIVVGDTDTVFYTAFGR